MSNKSIKVFIIAGEASGDMLASEIMTELKKRIKIDLYGTGGLKLASLGQQQYASADDMAVIGFINVVGRLPGLLRLAKDLERMVAYIRPDIIILVDYSSFNLHMSKRLKKYGIPVIQLVSPLFWVWNYGRVKVLAANYAKVLCIFPNEEEMLTKEGANAVYIGNPIVDRIKFRYDERSSFLAAHNIPADKMLIGLIPGSRRHEIETLMPVMVEAASRLVNVSFVLGRSDAISRETIAGYIPESLDIKIVDGETYDVMKYSDILWVCSGTATLEAGILGAPMVIIYKSNAFNIMLVKLLTKNRLIGMANIQSGREVVPELLGKECTPDNLLIKHREVTSNLQKYRDELAPLAGIFVGRHPVKVAADELIKTINEYRGNLI